MHDSEENEKKSKSQIKREFLALRDLGRELVELPDKALHQLPLSESFREAILATRQLKMEALRRQLKHIGKLLRDEDIDAIQIALENLRKPHGMEIKAFHEVESWRDALLKGDDKLLEDLCERFEKLDRQYIRQLLRNAKKEQLANKPPKSARILFRHLKELMTEADEINVVNE
jgi:ribosome-associated protein